jgi:membrane protease YdiL (CAAX protease family)
MVNRQLENDGQVRRPSGIPGLAEPQKRSYQGVAGTLLLVHALLVLLFYLLRRAWPALDRLIAGGTLQTYVAGGILMQGILILLPVVVIIFLCRLPTADLVGTKAKAGSLVLGFTVGIPAAVVFQGLNNLLIYALIKAGARLPEAAGKASPIGSDFLKQPALLIILVVLVSVVMPGLVEELMFRGVILASLSSAGAAASAVFWQALAFALFHADPLFLLPPFLAGLLLANIRRHSDSLWPAMLAHMSLNLSLQAINPLLPRLTAQYLSSPSSQPGSLLYASLIAACIAAVTLVPLLILISHMQAKPERTGARLRIWPADWKFAIAILVLVATMMIESS